MPRGDRHIEMMNLYDVLFFTEKFPYILKLQIEESENEYESEVKGTPILLTSWIPSMASKFY